MLTRVRAAATAAREKGALKTIETEYTILPTNPPFLVRVLKNLSEKSKSCTNSDVTTSAAPPKSNPFLPYDRTMYIQHVPPAHVLLLNKFNVVADHTLIVTEKFEEQSSLLTANDFVAMLHCLEEIPGLCFYNAGRIAGASQRHKHLQHIPGPLVPTEEGVTPFDKVLKRGYEDGVLYSVDELRFVHMVVGMGEVLKAVERGDMTGAGVLCMQRYTELLNVLGENVGLVGGFGEGKQPFSYNLVCTRDWMMVVPRRKECFRGISVNSLGFVGCLLVRDVEQLDIVRHVGGMAVLCDVAFDKH